MPSPLPAPVIKITAPSGNIVPQIGKVIVTVEVTNFNIADKLGKDNAPNEGHIHYFLDVDAPTNPGMPAIPASGVWAHVAATTYTFSNVGPGTHTISVELVNNNHIPLSPAVLAKVTITVQSPTSTSTPGSSVSINLTAQGFRFDKSTITAAAGASVTIYFTNADAGTPHNFALYTNSSATTPIFVGQTITGPMTVTYNFTAPATQGTYFFRCDVHPAMMTGSFVVTAASSSGSGGGGGGGGY